MKWSDFGPYVLPHVIGCPDPTMEQHVRLAAIEFFRRTLSWREVLDAVLTDGENISPRRNGNRRLMTQTLILSFTLTAKEKTMRSFRGISLISA